LSQSQAKPSPPRRLGLGFEESEAKARPSRGFQAKPSRKITTSDGSYVLMNGQTFPVKDDERPSIRHHHTNKVSWPNITLGLLDD
jgi:hypothetical protein